MLNKYKLKTPRRITFDTNPDQCNIRCIMCEEHSKYKLHTVKTNRVMDFQIVKEVIEECHECGLKEVIPSTMGEPLLYTSFQDLLDLIKRSNIKLNLTTNGTFPKLGAKEWGQKILPIASDVKISINGASKKVNESIMEGISFEKQVSNIRDFIEIRDKIRKNHINNPSITFQSTFMKRNIDELLNLLRLAIKLDIDRLKGHQLWVTHPQLELEDLRSNEKTIKKWNEIVDEMELIASKNKLKNGKKIKLDNINKISSHGIINSSSNDLFCPFLGREAWIAWDGRFNVCCAPNNLRKTFGYFGNVKDTNFMELWNSNTYSQLIKNWGSYDVCKMCNMRRPINQIEECRND